MTSSAIRETSTPIIASTNANSATTSRAAVASIELAAEVGEAQLGRNRLGVEAKRGPREGTGAVPGDVSAASPSRAVARRRAAAPRRERQVVGRAAPAGRAAGACDRAWPRRDVPGPAARVRRRRREPARRRRRDCSRRYIRTSVAIWSLRERPARSRPPSVGADALDQPAFEGGVDVLVIGCGHEGAGADILGQRLQAGEHAARSASVSSPARCSTRAWARCRPGRSGASRQSKCVERDSSASASAGPPAKRAPHRPRRASALRSGLLTVPTGRDARRACRQAVDLDEAARERTGRRCRPRRRSRG